MIFIHFFNGLHFEKRILSLTDLQKRRYPYLGAIKGIFIIYKSCFLSEEEQLTDCRHPHDSFKNCMKGTRKDGFHASTKGNGRGFSGRKGDVDDNEKNSISTINYSIAVCL